MKIQVVKKGTKIRVDIMCPYFIDVPAETSKKS
jgi:hypothetical protein